MHCWEDNYENFCKGKKKLSQKENCSLSCWKCKFWIKISLLCNEHFMPHIPEKILKPANKMLSKNT